MVVTEMTAADILKQASDLVSGDRHEQHGPMRENHENIAALWTAYLRHKVTPRDVAVLMALMKIARTKTGAWNPDDLIDGCGYLGIAGELADGPPTG